MYVGNMDLFFKELLSCPSYARYFLEFLLRAMLLFYHRFNKRLLFFKNCKKVFLLQGVRLFRTKE